MIAAARFCLMLFVSLLVTMFFCSAVANAGHPCRIRVQAVAVHHQAYVAPIVQNIYYKVGEQVQFEAAVARAVRQELSQWKSLETGKPVVPAEEPPAAATASMLTAKCASCHSGDKPKGGILLDGSAPLSCEQILQAMKKVEAGEMPPKGGLSPDDAGVLFSELLEFHKEK